VLIEAGSLIPSPWFGCARVILNIQTIADPQTMETVRRAYLKRDRLVLEVSTGMVRPEYGVNEDDVWDIATNFDFVAETTWRLATMNSVDARDPEAVTFPLVARAVQLGAHLVDDPTAEISLSDGTLAWCDGGPLFLWDKDDARLGGRSALPRSAIRQGVLSLICNHVLKADLATDQLAAVGDPTVRARVIAPAGSGKTRVLSERVRHLVRSGVPSSAIVLLAYNKRAEEEMRSRTSDLSDLEIRTIDALVLAIVNGTRGFLGTENPRRLIHEPDVRSIIAQLVKLPRRANVDPLGPWISALTQARLRMVSPADIEDVYEGDVDGFAEFYPRFRAHLTDNGLADFNEFVLLAVERLLREPQARLSAEVKAEVLLVDEFQDLTPAHMLLLRLLAGPSLSVFAVGDDDQTIYGFNGASPEWLVNFDEHVPFAVHHSLEVNYRCPAPVVTAATNLLTRNTFRVPKRTRPGTANVTDPMSLAIDTSEHQAQSITTWTKALLKSGAQPSDIVVLTRVNVGLLPPLMALFMEGIPVNLRDSENLLSGSGIDAALAWLRLATRPDSFTSDDVTLAARRPGRSIHPEILKWLARQRSMVQLQQMLSQLQDPAATKVEGFISDLDTLTAEATNGTTASALTLLNGRIGLGAVLASLDVGRPAGVKAANSDGVRSLLALAQLHPDASTFESWLREMLTTAQDNNGVFLSTVHKVKGLEWPHVAIYDASEDVFPHRLSSDLEEERRVFHVAITRSQSSLLITVDPSSPSPFLAEMNAPGGPSLKSTSNLVRERTIATASTAKSSRDGGRRSRQSPSGTPPVEAKLGLAFRWSGYDCVVSEVNEQGATIILGATRLTVEFGARVSVVGDYRTLSRPAIATFNESRTIDRGDSRATDGALREELKKWRRGQASSEGVPAFVVFYDTTLDELCEKLPQSLSDLRRVKGFGPVKVEKYGDSVLAIISENLR
jgi:DNA helicase-2/ATP-dependent DNA helicase PcrA